MNTIQTMRLILQLLPMIIEAVKAIETALPDGGNGEAKLKAVRTVLEAGYKTGSDLTASFEQIWPAVASTIGAVVALYNSAGQFKTAKAA